MSERAPVVVIGAGLGGLAAAIRLQARGYQVTLVERQASPGGRACVRHAEGHTFDSGPTVVTAKWLIEELFTLAGRDHTDYVKFVELDPYYQIRAADGRVFNYSGNEEKMLAEVERFSSHGAADVDGYRRFRGISEAIFKKGFEELGDVPFSHFSDMIKAAPALVRLQSFRSVYSLISKYFADDALRQVMSFHPLLIGGNPFDASSIYAMIHFLEQKWGVHFAMGGTGAIVDAMVKLLVEIGGELRLGTTVDEVLVENGRASGVRLEGGATIAARYVVANADAGWLYKHLVPAAHRHRWTDRKIDRTRFSMGLFVAYFGTTRRFEDVEHHTILLGPRYRELLDDIFTKKKLADDFSLYLHRPTKTDRSLAPPDSDTFYVLSPVPNLVKGVDNPAGIDWAVEGPRYQDKLLDHLDKHVMPGLRGSLRTVSHVSPQDFRDDLQSLHGAAFSVEPILTQSAWFRPHNESEDVPGLFLVGAGTHPGAGMPGVLCSARVVDRLVPRLAGDGDRDPIAGTHARA